MMTRLLLLSIITIYILSPVTDVLAQIVTGTQMTETGTQMTVTGTQMTVTGTQMEMTEVVTESMEEGQTTLPQEPMATTIPQEPVPTTIPQEPVPTTIPQEPVETTAASGATEGQTTEPNGNTGGSTAAGGSNTNGNGGTTAQNNGGGGTTASSNGGNNGGSSDVSVKVTLSTIMITNPDDAVFGLETGQNVDVDVSVVLQSGSGAVSGDNNWAIYVGLTNDSLSMMPDPSVGTLADAEAVLVPTTDVGVDLVAGETYTFSTTSTLSLVNITECVYSHLCVVIFPHSDGNWYVDEANSVTYRCQEVYCSGVSLKLHLVLVAAVMAVHALHKGVFCS